MGKTLKVVGTVGALVLVGVVMAAVSGGGDAPAGKAASSTSAPSAASGNSPTLPSAPGTAFGDDTPGTFGEPVELADGITVTAAKPAKYRASASAAGNDRDRAVLVSTTITNNSDAPYEFNFMIVGPTATHDGTTASSIMDIGNGIGGAPVTTIRPGASFTWKTALSIGANEADLQLEYRAGFGSSSALVVGRV